VGKTVYIIKVGGLACFLPTGESEIFFLKKYPSAIKSEKTQAIFWNKRSKRTVENHESSKGFTMRDGIPPYALQHRVSILWVVL